MAKADDGRKEVDKELEELEKKIEKEYKKATKDLEKKLNKYLSAFEEQDKKQKKLVDDGKLTEEQYKQWRLGKILSSNRWKDMRDKLADELTKVDKTAVGMINDFMPDAYAMGRNYGTYEVEKASKINTSFTLYDKDTVKGLIRNDPDLLPKPKVDIPADKRWNKEHINSSITQGILQGESVGKISKRLQDVTDMDRDSAIRNARTMTSAAENAGRVDSYKRAENMGIKMMQVWVATLDSRTRDAHRELDGQIRPVGEPFHNSIGYIQYPGDPHADPANVYNCRCTIIAKVEGSKINVVDDRAEKNGKMSYGEWKQNRKQQEPSYKVPEGNIHQVMDEIIPDGEWLKKSMLASVDNAIGKEFDSVEYKEVPHYVFKEYGSLAEKDISKKEYDIINDWSKGYIGTSNSFKINEYLRGNFKKIDKESKETIETLENIIDRNVVLSDALMSRYVQIDYVEKVFGVNFVDMVKIVREEPSVMDLFKGTVITENNFVSMSTDREYNVFSDRAVALRLFVDKGTKGYITGNDSETEVIMNPKTAYEIVEMVEEMENGKKRLAIYAKVLK